MCGKYKLNNIHVYRTLAAVNFLKAAFLQLRQTKDKNENIRGMNIVSFNDIVLYYFQP